MNSTNAGRKETERTKLIQEKCQTLLTQMLRDEDNKYCVDCDAKGPRWASWNLGVFLCIRCAGIHRNLGVHISRVKSVNLDTWTPEQVICLQQMGNSRARAVYEAQLPDGFRRPQTDTALESFIRAKYEHKKYLAREWVAPAPPKVDWAKEIDEELEKQKRKKKASQTNTALGLNVLGSVCGQATGEKKPTNLAGAIAKNTSLPAPLPKPKSSNQTSINSPKKTAKLSPSSTAGESDLLGLSSPSKPVNSSGGIGLSLSPQDLQNDSFSNFLSATATYAATLNANTVATNKGDSGQINNVASSNQNTLAQEEQDFFNQSTLNNTGNDKDKSGKLSKDSILALYGTQTTHNPPMNFGGFTGMSPGYMQQQQPQPQTQHHQFMTPPNSLSMYNAPVMTAPNAFTTPSVNVGAGSAGASGFGSQFPNVPYAGAITNANSSTNINLMQTNQSLLSGIQMYGALPSHGMTPQHPNLYTGGMGNSDTAVTMQQPTFGNMPNPGLASGFHQPTNANVNAASTANLNHQFGNLNIGNVWQ